MIKVNEKKVEVTIFPNNESLIRNDFIKENSHHVISLKFEGDQDLIHLMMIKNEIDNVNGTAQLNIPYMPYSRMDRTEGINAFTLKSVAKLINSLNFTKVVIAEPHSEVSMALLDKLEVKDTSRNITLGLINEKNLHPTSTYLVFPDAGAEKRYSKQFKDYHNTLTAIKHRDFKTGRIEKLEIITKGITRFDKCTAIIVDDLCSRGGTFELTANKLKSMGFEKIYLVITHCENSILDGNVLKKDSNIDEVFTTNSIFDEDIFNMNKEQFNMKYKNVDLSKINVSNIL